MENESSIISREKLDQVASWLSATVCTAFFSSLERFSCVNLSTTDLDDEDEDEDEAKDRPLTLTNYNNNEPSNDVANLPNVLDKLCIQGSVSVFRVASSVYYTLRKVDHLFDLNTDVFLFVIDCAGYKEGGKKGRNLFSCVSYYWLTFQFRSSSQPREVLLFCSGSLVFCCRLVQNPDFQLELPATQKVFDRLPRSAGGSVSAKDLKEFVDEYYEGAGEDVVVAEPEDFVPEPEGFLPMVKHPEVRVWALEVHSLWKNLSRKVSGGVHKKPELHTLCFLCLSSL
ncbi:hypothetical protein ACFX2C_014948 [Malus domestica]